MTVNIQGWKTFDSIKKKFLSRVEKTETCWFYKRKKTGKYRKGKTEKLSEYGKFCTHGYKYQPNRIAYMLFNGPIPYGLIVRHTCDNKLCVNPAHLILGSYADNSEDAVKRNGQGHQKLNSEAVKVIKWMLKYKPQRGLALKLARLHKVKPVTISNIKTGRSWHWINV